MDVRLEMKENGKLERYGLNIILESSSVRILVRGFSCSFQLIVLLAGLCILCNHLEVTREKKHGISTQSSCSALAPILGSLYNLKSLSLKMGLPKLQ